MNQTPSEPRIPKKRLNLGRGIIPIAIALSAAGHAFVPAAPVIGEKVGEGVGDGIHLVRGKWNQWNAGSDIDNLKDKLTPEQTARLKREYAESKEDKQMREKILNEREIEGKKLLKYIADHYDSMDVKEVLWKLEYYFQGVSDEDYQEAHTIVNEKISSMNLQGYEEPTPSDLDTFHQTFIPQGPKNPTKSSAVEFLASHLNSEMLNCDGAAKTLVLALLTRYPNLRNHLYFQFFSHHVRLLVDLHGTKYVFDWKKVKTFPDYITGKTRSVVIPVEVYYGLSAGREEKALLEKIQYLGPEVAPNEVNPPAYTNNMIPGFHVKEKLGRYRSIEDDDNEEKMFEELKKAKTDLEKERIKLKHNPSLEFPAETEKDKKALENFRSERELGGGNGKIILVMREGDVRILVHMDKTSLSDLKILKEIKEIDDAKLTFTGLKKMDQQTFHFITENFSPNELNFDDLEEITAEQMVQLFERTSRSKATKKVHFYSLKFVRGNPPPPITDFFDVKDLLLGNEDEIKFKEKENEQPEQPPPQYVQIDVAFHCLTDMPKEMADWFGRRPGGLTDAWGRTPAEIKFLHETNLASSVSKRLASFSGDIEVANPHAVSLVQGLKKHRGQLIYNGDGISIDMGQALLEHEGPVKSAITKYSAGLPILVQRTGGLKVYLHDDQLKDPAERLKVFKELGKKNGDLLISSETLKPEESALLTNHTGYLAIRFPDDNNLKANIEGIAPHQGVLNIHLHHEKLSSGLIDSLKIRAQVTELEGVYSTEFHLITGFQGPLIIHAGNGNGITIESIQSLSNNASVVLRVNRDIRINPRINDIVPNVQIENEPTD